MASHKGSKAPNKSADKEKSMPSQRFEEDDSMHSTLSSEDAVLPGPDDLRELHEQVNTLTKALGEEQEKATSYWERLLRKEAELQNVQKRSAQDLDNARKFALERFAQDLLQVLDSLDQGIAFGSEGKASEADLAEGMRLTRSVLMNIFEKQSIESIEPQAGDTFDPKFHEAISTQVREDLPANRIVDVIQKGYMLHNRLLRPARVVVSSAPASAE